MAFGGITVSDIIFLHFFPENKLGPSRKGGPF